MSLHTLLFWALPFVLKSLLLQNLEDDQREIIRTTIGSIVSKPSDTVLLYDETWCLMAEGKLNLKKMNGYGEDALDEMVRLEGRGILPKGTRDRYIDENRKARLMPKTGLGAGVRLEPAGRILNVMMSEGWEGLSKLAPNLYGVFGFDSPVCVKSTVKGEEMRGAVIVNARIADVTGRWGRLMILRKVKGKWEILGGVTLYGRPTDKSRDLTEDLE